MLYAPQLTQAEPRPTASSDARNPRLRYTNVIFQPTNLLILCRRCVLAAALTLCTGLSAQTDSSDLQTAQARLSDLQDNLTAVRGKIPAAVGDDRELLAEYAATLSRQYRTQLWEFAERYADEGDNDHQAATQGLLRQLSTQLASELDQLSMQLQQSHAQQSDPGNPTAAEQQHRRLLHERRDELIAALIANAQQRGQLGDPAPADIRQAERVIVERADLLSGRIELGRRRQQQINADLSALQYDSDEIAALKKTLNAQRRQLKSDAQQLSRMADLLESVGGDDARYKQTAFFASGDIGEVYLDTEVTGSIFKQWQRQIERVFIEQSPQLMARLLLGGLLLMGFWLISRAVKAILQRWLGSIKLDMSNLARDFIIGASSKVVLLIGVLIGLSQIGLQVGPLLAGLGIVGFVVGFALQDTLSNFASGMMILVCHPFDEGDYINAAGVEGTVRRMNLVSTTIYTVENHRLVVPNNKIWGDIIRNITSQKLRRVDLVFGVSYDDDIERVETVLRQVIAAHPLVMPEPETVIKLNRLADSAVEFIARPWVRSEHYLELYWDLQKQVKLAFDRADIHFPFPQREVTLISAGPPPGPPAAE